MTKLILSAPVIIAKNMLAAMVFLGITTMAFYVGAIEKQFSKDANYALAGAMATALLFILFQMYLTMRYALHQIDEQKKEVVEKLPFRDLSHQ